MHRQNLLQRIDRYKPYDENEKSMASSITAFIHSTPDCFKNTHPSGHITASAWIVDSSQEKVGLIHHAKLNLWLQPGGHSDGRPDTPRQALREAVEEFGDIGLSLVNDNIFDIDIHEVPEDRGRGLGKHLHYDVRFLVCGDSNMAPISSNESHDAKWVSIKDVHLYNDSESIRRMVKKTVE